MPRHLFVVFLSFYAELNFAAANDWNCEKNEAGEWSCVTELPHGQPKSQQPPVQKTAPQTTRKVTKPQPKPEAMAPEAIEVESKPAAEVSLPTAQSPESAVPVSPAVKKSPKVLVRKDEPAAIPKIEVAQNPAPVQLQPPSNEGNNAEGWTCAPNAENSTWNCHLVGENPKGETKVIAGDGNSLRLLNPAFDAKQEKAFKNLQKEFPFDPWQQCSAPNLPKQRLIPKKGLRETTPLEIEADYSEVFDKEVSSFTGNVEMKRADQHLLADTASYDRVSEMMDTQGNVYYSEDGLALFSNTASLKLATDKSILRNVLFESLSGPYRGSAEVAYKDSKDLSYYKEAAYTSCAPGNQDWVMHASRLKTNKESGEGSATNAWLEFKGVPILYTPYMSFPVDDRRKSGFFPPSLGRTAKSGFQLTTPYYWNIAPNYDILFKPRYLQTRGALLAADMRYLTELTQGSVGLEFMPNDALRKTSRFLGSLKNTTTFLPNLTANADLNYLSDKDYLYELGSSLTSTTSSYVKSTGNLNYYLDGLSFLAQVEGYQTIDNTIPKAARPYQKIPQINLDLNHSFESMPIDLAMNNEFVYFYRSGRLSGQRFNTRPSVSFPLSNSGVFATPKLSLQYTQYLLDNQNPGLKNNMNRTTPIASLDTGLFVEQEFQSGNDLFLHTLEPRAFYLYAPRTNQDNMPVFDSTLYDFNFASLFRENRFSSSDRVQDANQVSLALTSRLLDANSGQEYLKLGVGQIVYFNDRKVTLPGYPKETNRLSNLVTEMSGSLNQHFSYSAGTQWDPYRNQFPRVNAGLQFINEGNQVVNVGYLYRKDAYTHNVTIAQSDISFHWPIYDDWHLMGRWLYALNFNATKESFIGLEKDSCCWRFSVIGRRFSNALSNTVESKLQTGIFVQIELKGLGSFGDQVDKFLETNIPGYINPSKK